MFGLVFGILFGYWLQFIIIPDKLTTDKIEMAHRRWGYVIILIFTIGVFVNEMRQLVSNLQGANISTPGLFNALYMKVYRAR